MAVQMTRAEYEKMYGVQPVLPGASVLDDEKPAPIRMTRAEYRELYGNKVEENKPVSNVLEGRAAFPAQEGGAETVIPNIARTVGNIPGAVVNLARTVVAPVNPLDTNHPLNIGGNIAKGVAMLPEMFQGGFVSGIKNLAGGGKDTSKKGFDMYKKMGESIYDSLERNVVYAPDELTTEDAVKYGVNTTLGVGVSKLAEAILNDPTLIPTVMYTPSKVRGTGVSQDAISATARPVIDTTKQIVKPIINKVENRGVTKVVDEIAKIEDKYVKTRNANTYSKDVQASRTRIAESNVLDGAVDTEGVIRTKTPGGAIDQYKAQTIDGLEDLVRKSLESSKEVIPFVDVRKALVREVGSSGLEGADLVSALKKIDKEIEGLTVRTRGSSIIDLTYLHDAKIATTRNINYLTPPEKATYRKAVARAYKTLVENGSTKVDVKGINKELATFYDDIARLERLDGARAEGGRLGKYTASVAGTLIGGAAGSVGGGFGAAVGGILGGEAAAALKGAGMSRTFKGGGKGLPTNPVLEKARLSIPDKVVRAKAGVPKTKEIKELESKIAKNVREQKKAIDKGDFTLVAALKEVHASLVEDLKLAIKQAGEKTQSYNLGNRNTTYKATNKNSTTDIDSTIPYIATTPENVRKAVDASIEYQPEFAKNATNIANDLGLKFKIGDPKGATTKGFNRIVEKGSGEKGGNLLDVGDLNRAVLFVDKLDGIDAPGGLLKNIEEKAREVFGEVTEVKKTLGTPSYNKVIVNVKTPAGTGELQFTTPEMWEAKIAGGGDVLYGIARNPATPADVAKMLEERMSELYSNIDDSVLKRTVKEINEGGTTQDVVRNINYAGTPHISVSPFPERTVIVNGEVTANGIADFLEKNFDLMQKKGYAVGGWYNKASGETYLDVAVLVPKGKTEQAIKLSKDSNQISAFDLETFNEIKTGGTGEQVGAISLEDRQRVVDELIKAVDNEGV